jgi:hypothetical protein
MEKFKIRHDKPYNNEYVILCFVVDATYFFDVNQSIVELKEEVSTLANIQGGRLK